MNGSSVRRNAFGITEDEEGILIMKTWTNRILLTVCLLTTIGAICYQYTYRRNLWETVTAVATVWAIYVAYKQLGDSNTTSRADFIRRFSDQFFTQETRTLIMLLDCNALHFKPHKVEGSDGQESEPFPCFEIDETAVRKLPIPRGQQDALCERRVYSSYEMDDLLLGFFEDIALFERKGLIGLDEVYHHFDWYIDLAWNNPEIQRYIEQARDEDGGEDIYEEFENIAKRMESYGEAKQKRTSGTNT